MVKIFVTIALWAFGALAHAAFPPTVGYSYQFNGAPYSSSQSVCSAYATWAHQGLTGQIVHAAGTPNATGYFICNAYIAGQTWFEQAFNPVGTSSSCPANSTQGSGGCVCNQGFNESGSSCIPDDTQAKKCKALQGTEAAFTGGSKKYPTALEFCVGGTVAGCGASFTKSLGKETNGAMAYTWFGVYTGAKCGAIDNDVKPSECKGTWGQINGVNVCLSAGTDPAATTNTKTTDSGSKTTTSSPAPGASAPTGGASSPAPGSSTDGTTTSEKETTCTGTKCQTTTTTTKTNPDGSSTTEQTSKDEPKEDYCKENPKSFQCKEYQLGDVEAKSVVNKEIQLGITKASVPFGPETGSCPAPKTVQVMGINLSMPFTLLCQFAIQIKPLLIGFAWLSSILTFFGFARK